MNSIRQFVSRHEVRIVITMVALSFVLGFVGYWQMYLGGDSTKGAWNPADVLYKALLLFLLEADADTGSSGWPYSIQVARFLAPISVGWAAVRAAMALLDDEMAVFSRWRLKGHVVVCGTSALAVRLVEDLLAPTTSTKSAKVLLVGASPEEETKAWVRELGAGWIAGDAASPGVLLRARVNRASRLFLVTGDEEENCRIAATLMHILEKANRDEALHCHIELAPGSGSILKGEKVSRESMEGKFRAHVFNPIRMAAREMFRQHPPHALRSPDETGPPLHVLIIGFGRLAQEVFVQAIKTCHYADQQNVLITIVDDEHLKAWPRVKGTLEALSLVADVLHVGSDPRSLTHDQWNTLQARGPFDVVYIASENREEGVAIAHRVQEGLGQNAAPAKIVLCEQGEITSFPSRRHEGLDVFHVCEAHTAANIARYDLDRRAMAIHGDYCAKNQANAADWDAISEVERDQNRDPADHIEVKLHIAGFEGSPYEQALKISQDPAMVELLARVEHRRWMASKVLAGFRYADIPEQDKKRKLHPCLVDYSLLPDEEKEKDRDQVRFIAELLSDETKTSFEN